MVTLHMPSFRNFLCRTIKDNKGIIRLNNVKVIEFNIPLYKNNYHDKVPFVIAGQMLQVIVLYRHITTTTGILNYVHWFGF